MKCPVLLTVLFMMSVSCHPVPNSDRAAHKTNPEVSKARRFAETVNVNLEDHITTIMPKMPEDIVPVWVRKGDKRIATWTFSDGSQIHMTFVPAGIQNGLKLYMVELE